MNDAEAVMRIERTNRKYDEVFGWGMKTNKRKSRLESSNRKGDREGNSEREERKMGQKGKEEGQEKRNEWGGEERP